MNTMETIAVGDGTVSAYIAGPSGPGAPGVVLLHAWWGLDEDVRAFADRLAGEGFAVLAPDFFAGRVATTVEGAEALATGMDEDLGDAVALGAADALAARLGDGARIGAVGFSFGAAWALWLPSRRPNVSASVVYYGSMTGPSLARATAPVLGHFAEADPFESDETIAEMEGELRAAGRAVTIHRYPGTGHWFAEPSKRAYVPEAAELAFERTVAFLRVSPGQ